jgi:hypothetical protein
MFPKFCNDPFYKQFDNPLAAYSNIFGLYKFYIENPCHEVCELDHVNYARRLASMTLKRGDVLPSKKDILHRD